MNAEPQQLASRHRSSVDVDEVGVDGRGNGIGCATSITGVRDRSRTRSLRPRWRFGHDLHRQHKRFAQGAIALLVDRGEKFSARGRQHMRLVPGDAMSLMCRGRHIGRR